MGDRNVLAVRKQLRQCSIPIAAEDVGGSKGRKMLLDPATGHVEIAIIGKGPRII